MAGEGTAVLDMPGTGAELLATDIVPESEGLPEAPDSAGVEGTTDSDEAQDPLAEFDEEALKSNPRVAAILEAKAKEIEARLGESFRQKQEREVQQARDAALMQQYEQRRTAAGEQARREALNALTSHLHQWQANEGTPVPIEQVDRFLGKAYQDGQIHTVEALNARAVDYLSDPQWLGGENPPIELAQNLLKATASNSPARWIEAFIPLAYHQIGKRLETAIRAQVMAELGQARKDDAKVEADAAPAAKRMTQPRPTNTAGKGSSASGPRTVDEAAALFVNDQISASDFARYKRTLPEQLP